MSTTELPPHWQPEPALEGQIPTSHDWRSFGTIPYAPRYAASITGQGVYDLLDRCFRSPIIDTRDGRKRYRLVTSDPKTGKLGAVKRPYYASIILTLVEGARPNGTMQAHHTSHDRTQDHWQHLGWAPAPVNRQLAAKHKSRAGSANPNAKIASDDLAKFIEFYDNETQTNGRPDLKSCADYFGTSVDQLRRIVTERSRTAEVQAIRQALRRRAEEIAEQEAKEAAKEAEDRRKRRISPMSARINPFLQ